MPVSYFKVGGLHFVRLGRLQVSWCMVRRRPSRVALRLGALVRAWN